MGNTARTAAAEGARGPGAREGGFGPRTREPAMRSGPAVPVIGVSACRKYIAPHPFHAVGEKYLAALSVASRGLPLMVPALGQGVGADALLSQLDGLFLTGSPSNVEPHQYRAGVVDPEIAHDPHRDATTLPLIRRAVALGVPLLGVCRGCQEMNVAFGGTLHQKVQEVEGLMDHREDPSRPLAVQYGPAHEVRLEARGLLARLAGRATLPVNSLHAQGVKRLADGLRVEATAPDGLIEAFRVEGARTFACGVQWHPEWQVLANPFSTALFEAFGDACRARAARRRGAAPEHAPAVSRC